MTAAQMLTCKDDDDMISLGSVKQESAKSVQAPHKCLPVTT